MPKTESYVFTETLFQGHGTMLFRGLRTSDRRPVVVKVLGPERPSSGQLEQLKNEYEIGKGLDAACTLKVVSLETLNGMPALISEDFAGKSLDHFLLGPLKVENFLRWAIPMADAVAEIHRQHVVHKDLKPTNILVNPLNGEIKIADFGIAFRQARESHTPRFSNWVEGSYPYISPEQTGRMNRDIDNRSDLYSLGVTFYQMITGRLPFNAQDPVEWVYCHIARTPPPPAEVIPGLPITLSDIVMKLLAKMAEDRYQSAQGLKHDLVRCLGQWEQNRSLTPFVLGSEDLSEYFRIPQKLYGRENETAVILGAFERVVATGTPELVMVSGYSGIGKSALINELHRPLTRERGIFITGKFDQYLRNVPYSTVVQAFRELVLEILSEDNQSVATWKERLLEALAGNGQLIVDVVPQLELLIGKQSPVIELPLTEAQHRFRTVLQQFIGVFTRHEHPVVFFLDDLQWADSASLALIQDLLANPTTHHLLLMGAYRNNEVTPTHPLMLTIEKARQAGASFSRVELGPLSFRDLTLLTVDALHCAPEHTAGLVEVIQEKTSGNPFFTIQFLTMLYDENLLAFEQVTRSWRWDVSRIRAQGFTDNVVELMVSKLNRLPEQTLGVLKIAACIGNSVEAAVLALVQGQSEVQVQEVLWSAVSAGLIVRVGNSYKFLHDRIQEGAYSMIAETSRAGFHLRIGRFLFSQLSSEVVVEKIFDIVNQLNLGAVLIENQSEKNEVAQLNLIAGKKAKTATAYSSAISYLAAGVDLLTPDCWHEQYELAYPLFLNYAECEYLDRNFARALPLLDLVILHARTRADVVAPYYLKVTLHENLGQNTEAVAEALKCLRLFGIEWAPHPTWAEVEKEYRKIWENLGDRRIEDLIQAPRMSDSDVKTVADFICVLNTPALYTDANLLCLQLCRTVNLSLRHGNTDGSASSFVFFGIVLGPIFGEYRKGYRFGLLGYDLVEKHGMAGQRAKVYLTFAHIVPWTQSFDTAIEVLGRAFDASLEAGDLNYACYTRNVLITHLIVKGSPLGDVFVEAQKALEFVRKAQFKMPYDIINCMLKYVQNLRGLTTRFSSFSDDVFDQGQYEVELSVSGAELTRCWYFIWRLQANFMAENYQEAIQDAAKAKVLLWTTPSFSEVPEYGYFTALAMAAQYDQVEPATQRLYLEALLGHQKDFLIWQENCPDNFLSKYSLISAEIARISGSELEAQRLYEQAIESARKNGFIQNEGIANELASRYYRARGLERIANTYLREARACYLNWGAHGKVRQMDLHHPYLVERQPLAPSTTFAVRAEQLDLLSIAKASQTISGEVFLDKLAPKLLEVVLMQSGAQYGYLILTQGTELYLRADATFNPEKGVLARILSPTSVSSSSVVPVSIVNFVQRSKQVVILEDAGMDAGKFALDEYFKTSKVRSLLCTPILRQGKAIGVLYLENHLVAGAFTSERLTILELLASQAAISLENALLYSNLHQTSIVIGNSPTVLFRWKPSKTLLTEYVSENVAQVFGYDREALLSGAVDFLSIVHPEDREQVLQRSKAQSEYRIITHDGRVRWVDDRTAIERDESGRITYFQGVLTDITDRKQSEEERLRLIAELKSAIALRDEFLSIASHELRTPLTSLRMQLEMVNKFMRHPALVELPEAKNFPAIVRISEQQFKRLSKLVNDLLDVSKIGAGSLSLGLEQVDLVEVVRGVLDSFQAEVTAAQCVVSLQADVRVEGSWDRSRIEQVVVNLFSNAIKYGARKPITIQCFASEGTAKLVVRDQGIGIAQTDLARIFNRYERAVSWRHFGGLGLGLYIVRQIVEAHSGRIQVESEPGIGTAFIVELPFRQD